VDPKGQSIPEANAYRTLQVIVGDLRRAERTLAEAQERAPEYERAHHLEAIRAARAELETFVVPLPED
jgi:hypothetical protein